MQHEPPLALHPPRTSSSRARYNVATKAESRAAVDKKRATTEALRRYVTEQRLVEAVRQALEDEPAELARDEQMRGRT